MVPIVKAGDVASFAAQQCEGEGRRLVATEPGKAYAGRVLALPKAREHEGEEHRQSRNGDEVAGRGDFLIKQSDELAPHSRCCLPKCDFAHLRQKCGPVVREGAEPVRRLADQP